jgi:hypothetical protein
MLPDVHVFIYTLRIPGSVIVAYALTPTSAASPTATGLSGATKPAASYTEKYEQ